MNVNGCSKVDFYISSESNTRYKVVCRLVDKAYQQGHRIDIATRTEQETNELDKYLWTFQLQSFIPHARTDLEDNSDILSNTPVLINHLAPPSKPPLDQDILVNLRDEIPEFTSKYARIAEVIDYSDETRRAGRLRYQQYKEQHYEIQTHHLK